MTIAESCHAPPSDAGAARNRRRMISGTLT